MDKRGKVVVSVLALFVLLASMLSYFVLAEGTNTKSYDSSTRTVTIKNGMNEIAQIKLNTPLVYSVIRGKDRLVAEFTINNSDIYTPGVLGGIDFYNLKEDNTKISRTFTYKYKFLTGYKDVPTYETKCSIVLNETNGKEYNSCTQVQNGIHKEEIYDWKEFAPSDLSNFPKGITAIGIFADVYAGDKVEWQPTLYGVKITEWASWEESLSVGLIEYYGMNEGTGTTTEDYINLRNGNLSNTNWMNGKNDYGIGFFTNISIMNASKNVFPFTATDSWTISFWYNRTASVNSDQQIFNKADDSSTHQFRITTAGADFIIWIIEQWGVDAYSWYCLGQIPYDSSWKHFVVISNGTTNQFLVFMNGTALSCGAGAEWGSRPTDMTNNANVYIGNWYALPSNSFVEGSLDEFAIWNRSLSASEIADLYDNGEGSFYSPKSPPSIPVLLSPANNSGFGMYSTVTFVWSNSTDADGDTIKYQLEIYNESDIASSHLIYSNYSISEGSQNTSINIKLSDYTTKDDDYYWRVRANDSTNMTSNWSQVRHFQYANWTITFNLTDAETGQQISTSGVLSFDISCNNSFSIVDVDNPYTATDKFVAGNWGCNFSGLDKYYAKTQIITVNNDSIIIVPMSPQTYLTQEEHTWLEWLYNCWNNGICRELLEDVNRTAVNIWQRLTGTNKNVITQEDVLSYTLSSSQNISINYTINVPYKEGVPVNELLPIRIYFWFTDASRTTCYSQDKASDTNRAEAPYCLPLVAETLGPNNGTVTFKVDLRPALATGTYNFTRSVEIDPIGIWTQYGREDLGQVKVLEDNHKVSIDLIKTPNLFFDKLGITGNIIGKNILTKENLMFFIISLNTIILIYFIISSKIKKK